MVMSHRAGGNFAPDPRVWQFEALVLAVKVVDTTWSGE